MRATRGSLRSRWFWPPSSPRRTMLLGKSASCRTLIVSPDIDETPGRDESPRLYAVRMARGKAAAVTYPGHLVLAADTVVAAGRRILPKAETDADVRAAWNCCPAAATAC